MTQPVLTRPRLAVRLRPGTLALGTLAAGGLVAIGIGVLAQDPPTVTVAAPDVTVSAPSPVPIMVRPADVIVQPAPPPPPPPAPPVEEVPPPRALAPTVDASCLLPDSDSQPHCTWHDGFPAIAGDGSLIATKHFPDDTGRGYPGLSIRFVDPATSRVVRTVVVLSPDEYDDAPEARPKLLAKITRRAAAIQRTLDAGDYRSMISLGVNDAYSGEVHTSTKTIHAEFSGALVRIVDTATATVIARYDFGVPAPQAFDTDDMCSGWGLGAITVAWDPPTRTVLATSLYDTGGCMCDAVEEIAVRRLR